MVTTTCFFSYYQNYLQSNGTIIVKLERALYGCIQSARLWYDHIPNFLISIGFLKSDYDECVFTKVHGEDIIHIGMFVDDFIITSKNFNYIKEFEDVLRNKFKEITINHNKVQDYLGMQLDFTKSGEVNITMPNYIDNLITEYNINKFKKYPSDLNLFNITDEIVLSQEKQEHLHSGVAKLLYLSTRTRPDISLPVNFLCTRVNKFTAQDEKKFISILEYINSTRNIGIILKNNLNNDMNVQIYADASYGSCQDTRCSQTGLCIMVNGSPILWKSSRQKIVTKSSTEAELVAAADSVSYGFQIKNLLKELGYENITINIFQDNQSTIHLIKNNKPSSQRSRHIDIKYFFLRNRVDIQDINIIYTPTQEMIADLFTKPIVGNQFIYLRDKIINNN